MHPHTTRKGGFIWSGSYEYNPDPALATPGWGHVLGPKDQDHAQKGIGAWYWLGLGEGGVDTSTRTAKDRWVPRLGGASLFP